RVEGGGLEFNPLLPPPSTSSPISLGSMPMASLDIRIRIGPADHGRAMTLEEFREAEEEEGYCYELARGVLEVTEVPNDPHWQIISNLQGLFHLHRVAHPGIILRIGG